MTSSDVPEKVVVKDSPIHGSGCFAAVRLCRNARLLEYVGEKITKEESERRGWRQQERAKEDGSGAVYIFELNDEWDIDGNVPENIARFMNHSCSPNCEALYVDDRIWYTALRDIEAGEELFIDYGYDLSHFLEHPCRCGAPECPGYIVREDQRRKLRRMLARARARI